MKTTIQTVAVFLVAIALSVSGCAPSQVPANPTDPAGSTPAPTDVPVQATATSQPTEGPTATVWPPVYDPNLLGDIRDQDSFVVTVKEQSMSQGQQNNGRTLTMGYIREPYAGYFINEYSSGVEKSYLVDGRSYTLTGTGDWYIEERDINILDQANLPEANTSDLAAAEFVGEEEYEGIPAYHFVLEQVNLPDSSYTIEGEFYLAKEGNYVLFSRWKSGTSDADYWQITTSVSAVNQLTEISLPPEMQDMPTAAEVPVELALPLPPDSSFLSMIRYQALSSIDRFWFSNPFVNEDEFLEFYRNLPGTDGWTVSHIGFVTRHGTECQEIHECVIINKGSTQVVLAIDPLSGNSLRAEFDWGHIFSPIVGP